MFLSKTFLAQSLFGRTPSVAWTIAAGVYLVATTAAAASLESAQMGPPGKTGGNSIASGQSAVGWRFEVSVPFQVQRIGGHLLSHDQQPIYGAIIALDSITSLPHGEPFNPDEVVASTTFVPPTPSDEILLPFTATLAPGAYALLFGTNNLGATGIGAIPNSPTEQPDIPPTTIDSYIIYGIPRPNAPLEWRERLSSGMRMIVRGTTVGLTADFDIDGDVDGDDFLTWQAGFGVDYRGDTDDDGDTDGDDFLNWQTQFGSGGGNGASDVPEPGTLGLLGLMLIAYRATPGFRATRDHQARRHECQLSGDLF